MEQEMCEKIEDNVEEKFEYTLLPEKLEDEKPAEYIERIAEVYREIPMWDREGLPYKHEVRMYLYKEEKMLDSEMAFLLRDVAPTIRTWRRKYGLESNFEPKGKGRRIPTRSYQKSNFEITPEERERVIEFVAKLVAISEGRVRI